MSKNGFLRSSKEREDTLISEVPRKMDDVMNSATKHVNVKNIKSRF